MAFFTRFKVPFTLKLSIWASLAALVLLLLAFYIFKTQPLPKPYMFFKQDNQVKTQGMGYMHQPIVSELSLLQWVIMAATAAYTYRADNYKTQLNHAMQTYFTPEGAQGFMTALEQSGALRQVANNNLIVTSVVTSTPVILAQGPLLGEYAYKIQIPLLVTYQSASEVQTDRYIVSMLVVLVDPSVLPTGYGIKQFVVQRAV